ncbi:predicted protein [Verticillium alfalfae VaMs.102]|uniref:Predicted protein n=1 Tax=Verticillium alfalfae (strain VaMs.102 / ATCC MYA-4576 / FGSC 10136) TaxID=526221 RepID=C9SBB8_VERA1|nr:predicted protein [Verticillium alfalfae VaMs.102]EEY15652.1 predicted protein [Verticillium alfalfae VaMs.102]
MAMSTTARPPVGTAAFGAAKFTPQLRVDALPLSTPVAGAPHRQIHPVGPRRHGRAAAERHAAPRVRLAEGGRREGVGGQPRGSVRRWRQENTETAQGSRGGGVTPQQQLEGLRREAKVPVLTGTVWMTIRKPQELIGTPFEKLRQMADRLVGGLLERHEGAGKPVGLSRRPKKTGRKVERASRGSRNEDLDAEFGDLGPSLTKDDFF